MGKVSKGAPSRRICSLIVATLFAAAFLLLVNGGMTILGHVDSEASYAALARQMDEVGTSGPGRAEASTLPALPEGAVAWMSVAGTSIDYPVAQASEGEPSFYLSHDLWGKESGTGCPYLDWRCGPNGTRALVYAHRMGTTGRQFSPIADTWKQEEFDGIGQLAWTTSERTNRLQPLCALKVDKGYQRIQDFSAQGTSELHSWLRGLVSDSSARSADSDQLIDDAERAITLVTCSSLQGGQRDRTLLVFVC